MTRVCVCGGRTYNNSKLIWKVLDQLYKENEGNLHIITGGAKGADTIANLWALQREVSRDVVPADWKTHGKAAGPLRNKQMIDMGFDILVAFPGGRGTANMVHQTSLNRTIKILNIVDTNEDIS